MKRIDILKQQIMFYENNLDKLSPEDLATLDDLRHQLTKSKKGKSAKVKGASYERTLAKIFKQALDIDLVRTPQSGGFAKNSEKADEFRGDITSLDNTIDFKLHIEAKNHKTWNLKQWLKQAREDCPKGKIPTVIMHQPQTMGKADELIVLRLEDFLDIVNRNKIITKK